MKKCKGLLGIAQKAKQAKDGNIERASWPCGLITFNAIILLSECQEENRRLKEQLGHFETQKNADKECIKAMQEVADSYMDQKLQATMKVDELEKQMTKLKAQLADEVSAHEQQTKTMRLEMDQLKEKLALLERGATTCSAEQF